MTDRSSIVTVLYKNNVMTDQICSRCRIIHDSVHTGRDSSLGKTSRSCGTIRVFAPKAHFFRKVKMGYGFTVASSMFYMCDVDRP